MATIILNAQIVLPPDAGGPRITPLRFDQSRILSLDKPPQRGDKILDFAGKAVYPGLINAHDHLEMNHYPRTKFREQYSNAEEWSKDFRPYLDEEPFRSLRREPLARQCQIGGIKNVRSGVTTVAHHNPLHPPLRQRDFAVRVVQQYGWAHSLYLENNVAQTYRRTPKNVPWMIHLAEGTDDAAADELAQLQAMGCLAPNTILIHGVGLTSEDRQQAVDVGVGLVWCPSSNFFLLGATATVGTFAAMGLLALGTDSRLTADGDMLDELKAAYATGQLSSIELFEAMTTNPAKMLRLRNAGALLPGYLPDFFITRASDDPYAELIQLTTKDIEAVYIGGVNRLNRTEL